MLCTLLKNNYCLMGTNTGITEQDPAKYLFNFSFYKKINVVQKFSLLLKYLKVYNFIILLFINQSIPFNNHYCLCGCKRRLYSRTALSSQTQYRYN